MAQVSVFPLSKKVYERIFEILFKSIAGIKKKKEVEDFFNDFLSPTERIVLAKRLAIAVMLAKGHDYSTIRKTLKVSPPTIAAVNGCLRYAGEGYQKVIDRLMKEEAIKDAFLDLGEGVADAGSLMRPGKEMWQAVGKEIQKKRKEKQF